MTRAPQLRAGPRARPDSTASTSIPSRVGGAAHKQQARPPARPRRPGAADAVSSGSGVSLPAEAVPRSGRSRPLRTQQAEAACQFGVASGPAAAPAGPAGCRGSPRRCGPAPARRAVRGSTRPSSSRASSRPQAADSASCGQARKELARQPAPGPRTRARRTPPPAGEPRTRGSAPMPGRATARRRSTQTSGRSVGGLGQQAEDGQAQQEAVRRGAGPQTEGRAERVPLRPRDAVETVQQRARTAGAGPRRRAPPPLARRPSGPPDTRTPARPGTPAAPTCRSRPPPGLPKTGLMPPCKESRSSSSCRHSVPQPTSIR